MSKKTETEEDNMNNNSSQAKLSKQTDPTFEQFADFLREMFETDKSDLDFGIYRIMKEVNGNIEEFINTLQPIVEKEMKEHLEKIKDTVLEDKLTDIENKIGTLTVELLKDKTNEEKINKKNELEKEFEELTEKQKELADISTRIQNAEKNIYEKLLNFFKDYYNNGDFISRSKYRKYGNNRYTIPYDGEEVKLHWANHDQYFIKNTENFKNYSFKIKDSNKMVYFKLIEIEPQKTGEGSKDLRKFIFNSIDILKDIFTVNFSFGYEQKEEEVKHEKGKTTDSKDKNFIKIKDKIKNNKDWNFLIDGEKESILSKQLSEYTGRNTFDYFIHKNLELFLKNELDSYIKNEVMKNINLDNFQNTNDNLTISEIKVIKTLGETIIEKLAKMEEFQKNLWLKKKMAVETNWCITLDRIDINKVNENTYRKLLTNKEQLKEWKQLYNIEGIDVENIIARAKNKDGELKQYIVDTKHFLDIKDKLIASIDNIDNETNGIMFYSENFQALNLLQEKYKEKIKCIYIDPPYNTGSDGFVYKDGFSHSSWLSMITDRLTLAKETLSDDGVVFISIDEKELSRLKNLCDEIFGAENCIGIAPRKTKGSATTQSDAEMQDICDYVVIFSKEKKGLTLTKKITGEKSYPYTDNNGRFYIVPLQDNGPHGTRQARRNLHYPIYQLANGDLECDEPQNYIDIFWPTKHQNTEGCWMWSKKKFNSDKQDLCAKDSKIFIKHYYNAEEDQHKYQREKLWIDKFSNSDGTKMLNSVIGEKGQFSNPKPIELIKWCINLGADDKHALILDFFAGSGTTAHAVIDLNREEKDAVTNGEKETVGNRKYILAEMGDYFDTVTLPRVKKVIYSKDWKDGVPTNIQSGISQIVKYMKLESYDDTLDNVDFNKTDNENTKEGDDSTIDKYDFLKNIKDTFIFEDLYKPFDYKMKITESNAQQEKTIDVCETFNYLIGLNVEKQSEIEVKDSFKIKYYKGKNRSGRNILVIWRDFDEKEMEKCNDILKNFIKEKGLSETIFDLVYINGDSTIAKSILSENEMKSKVYKNGRNV